MYVIPVFMPYTLTFYVLHVSYMLIKLEEKKVLLTHVQKKIPSMIVQCILWGSLLLFSCSVMSDSLQPHGLQHARLPCPSPSPRVCLNSCPLSQWRYPAIWSSLISFSFCPSIFPSIRVISNESALCLRWPKYWSFSISWSWSISPSNEYFITAQSLPRDDSL